MVKPRAEKLYSEFSTKPPKLAKPSKPVPVLSKIRLNTAALPYLSPHQTSFHGKRNASTTLPQL